MSYNSYEKFEAMTSGTYFNSVLLKSEIQNSFIFKELRAKFSCYFHHQSNDDYLISQS